MAAESDGTYLERRARQSLAAESVATDRSARLAHGQLAAAYAQRAFFSGAGEREGDARDDAQNPGEPEASPDPKNAA